MHRKLKTQIVGLLLLMILGPMAPGNQPNFLIIVADDMSYHDLGCYGNPEVRTPNLDALAKQGTRFTRCYNSSPMCAPTRMSLFTGIHPVRNGGYPNHSQVHDSIRSLPQYLKELGYTTALLGKTHFKPLQNFPFVHLGGRSHDNGKGLDLDLAKARRFFDTHQDQPWCLVVASNQPHQPWNRGDPSAYPPSDLTIPPYLVDTPETRLGLSQYYAEITYLDQQVGTTLEHLEASGQADNTLVLFLSEQGSNFPYCKWTCYETGLRSAAIARWPDRIPKNRVSDALIQYVDVVPTFLQLSGGDPDKLDLDGESLAEVFQGSDKRTHTHIFGLQTSKGIFDGPDAYGIRTVRDDRFRLIWNINHKNTFSNLVTTKMPTFKSWQVIATKDSPFAKSRVDGYLRRPEYELYDLQNDPWCMQNVIHDPSHTETLASLKQALQDWMMQQGDQGSLTEHAALDRMPGKR